MKHGEVTNYKELEAFGMKYYSKGGSQFVECWDDATLEYFKKAGEPLTWELVYKMVSMEKEEAAAAEFFGNF